MGQVMFGLVAKISEFLDRDKSVRRVADDVQMTAELILLIRLIFADGRLAKREMASFKKICNTAFGIPDEDIGDVVTFLRDAGYETSAEEAAMMFAELDEERKRALLLHMLSIAKSDDDLDSQEIGLIRRTAAILGYSDDDLAALQG